MMGEKVANLEMINPSPGERLTPARGESWEIGIRRWKETFVGRLGDVMRLLRPAKEFRL